MLEKFSIGEVTALRSDLIKRGLDSFQIAEAIKMFVSGHGYGISSETALSAASRIEGPGYNVESLQKELETLVWVM